MLLCYLLLLLFKMDFPGNNTFILHSHFKWIAVTLHTFFSVIFLFYLHILYYLLPCVWMRVNIPIFFSMISLHVFKKRCLTSVDICPSWMTGRSCRHMPAAAASLSRRCQRSRSSTPGWQPEPGSHPLTLEMTGPFGWCNFQTCSPVPH